MKLFTELFKDLTDALDGLDRVERIALKRTSKRHVLELSLCEFVSAVSHFVSAEEGILNDGYIGVAGLGRN
jgi:hypothetical protein